jgi:galactonate dehydratase
MRLDGYEILHCDAGWRKFSFLRLHGDDGTTGIAEFNESYGSPGLSGVIAGQLEWVKGADAMGTERISSELYARSRQAHGGMAAQATAAVENALLDMKGKRLGVPCYELLGGKVRDRLKLYWSHCGSYRLPRTAHFMDVEPIRTLDDIRAMGAEVAERGFSALKTNIFLFDDEPHMHQPGFARTEGWPELNASREVIAALRAQLEMLREGAGDDVDIMLDLNFNFRTEGYLTVARALDDLGLCWFEIDLYDAPALAEIRHAVRTPIASCESLFGLRGFRPFLAARAMDVAIIDVPWNGIWQSLKIAATAEAHEINVAPHNFYGHLSTLMSAHLCAAIPNFRIMEIDIDDVPWKDDIVTNVPLIKEGYLHVPDGPGWGTELNDDALAAHPVAEVTSMAHNRGMG